MASVGIIGTGWGARVQTPAFREAGLVIGGIAGSRPEKTRQIAGELNVKPFDDWRALVADPAIDVITVTTPPSQHLEMARAALEAGKHVVSEKPTALDAVEAEELVGAAKKHPKLIAIIDHELRFLPAWRTARERITEIGAIRYAEIRYASPSRGDRKREWGWVFDRPSGGGIWGAVGSHFVDTLRYLGLEVDAVQAELRTVIEERPNGNTTTRVTADDVALVHLRLRGGAVATITLSWVAAGADEASTITVHGESGALRLTGEQLLMAQTAESFIRVEGGEMQQRPGNSPGGAFGTGTLLLGHALRAALEGDHNALAPAATFNDGLAQQRVLDAARRSNENEGRWERA